MFNVNRLPEFERDLKALTKRYHTLSDDLNVVIASQIRLYHEHEIDNGGIKRIPNVGDNTTPIFKVTKFACRSLKGRGARTGLRLIYAFLEEEKCITLIDLYFKGDKANEDRARIEKHYRKQR